MAQQSDKDETLSRVRRIETRLTQLMIGLGVGTQAQKPVFNIEHGTVRIPSMHSSLQEIIAAIPEGWTSEAKLIIGDQYVGRYTPGGA